MTVTRLLVLGCGYAGLAMARRGRSLGLRVLTTTRSEERAASLRVDGFDVVQAGALDESIAAHVDGATHVAVAYQPDPATDVVVSRAVKSAHSAVYVSSTGVYGSVTGHVDDTTPVPPADERAAKILGAETLFRDAGAVVLRCPGIYGPSRGLHVRVLGGDHRLPGDGTSYTSRIHIEDLASFALAAARVEPGTFVVGDDEPARQIDVVRWICETYGVPMPPSVPADSVHASLRADRRIDASRAKAVFGVTLRFPSFRDGMAPAVTGLRG